MLSINSRDSIPREDTGGEEKYKLDRSYNPGKLGSNDKFGSDGCLFYQSPILTSAKKTNRLRGEKPKNTAAGITGKTTHFSDMESSNPIPNGKIVKIDYNAQDENYF